MKNTRLEIRIEEEKKHNLEVNAQKLNLRVSELISILIDDYINDNKSVENYLSNASEIAQQLVKINLLAGQIDNEIGMQLLKELGVLECLI